MNWLREYLNLLKEIGVNGIVDIALMTLGIYVLLVAIKRTRRSGLILTGVLVVTLLYILALKLNLVMTVTLLQGFFTVFVVALVVIFQEDLRYFLERVGSWWFVRRRPGARKDSSRLERQEADVLVRTLGDLSRARIGALVVIRGHDVIARHLDGGEEVDGRLSEPLLKSIFDPHSIGHDGAVVLEGNRIGKLGCHLPLSHNLEKLPGSGTRHAAALGLSELSDALCIVVSEERGTISVARRGAIGTLADPSELGPVLDSFYNEVLPVGRVHPVLDFFKRNAREKAIAFGLSFALWITVVYRSQNVHRSFGVPFQFSLLGSQFMINQTNPPEAKVTFSGPRRNFTLLEPREIKLVLNLEEARLGSNPYPVNASDVIVPNGLSLDDIEPRHVRLNIVERGETNGVKTNPTNPPPAIPPGPGRRRF
jgi:uncharacterized protein (TIGR00159 family)